MIMYAPRLSPFFCMFSETKKCLPDGRYWLNVYPIMIDPPFFPPDSDNTTLLENFSTDLHHFRGEPALRPRCSSGPSRAIPFSAPLSCIPRRAMCLSGSYLRHSDHPLFFSSSSVFIISCRDHKVELLSAKLTHSPTASSAPNSLVKNSSPSIHPFPIDTLISTTSILRMPSIQAHSLAMDSLVAIGTIARKEFLLAGVELEEIVVLEDEEEEIAPPPTPKEKPEEIRALAEIEANSVAAYDNPTSFVAYNWHHSNNAKSTTIDMKNSRSEKAALAAVVRFATAKTGHKKKKVETAKDLIARRKRSGAT